MTSALATQMILVSSAMAQVVTIDGSSSGHRQVIDGFGTCGSETTPGEPDYQKIYFEDMRCSIQRVDITPRFKAPFNGENKTYNSPWFHRNPSLPGPDNNNVRTYSGAKDYGRPYNGVRAPIAVMGPNIEDDAKRYFDFDDPATLAGANCAKAGAAKIPGFKLVASLWSPAPWVKIASGRKAMYSNDPMPKNNPPYPFIWFNCFAGGVVDTSGVPRPEFDDAALPEGHGPTSALTQFARGLAAYLYGYQKKFGLNFYSISLQNEPHLELFYNSCGYRTSSDYIAVLKAARRELDKYPELKPIKIMGFEDTMGSESTYLWFWNDQGIRFDKFLKVMNDVEADPEASKALSIYAVHGYAVDGIQSAGADAQVWRWCKNGWSARPNPQVPDNVKGYASYGKSCWMTETSGETAEWLSPKEGFPKDGAFSIALKIHQALTVGDVSAWLYWQMGKPKAEKAEPESLISSTTPTLDPKYVAAKHYFRFIRPGAQRLDTSSDRDAHLLSSAFVHRGDGTVTVVLINTGNSPKTPKIVVPKSVGAVTRFDTYSSSSGHLWQTSKSSCVDGSAMVEVPAYGIVTLVGLLSAR